MNIKYVGGIIIVALVVIGIATFAVSRGGTPSSVKIGVIDVLSGDKAQLGKNFQKGIEMARDEYVAAHPGTKVELVFEDDAYDGTKGFEAFKKLQAQKVDALIVATTPTINSIYSVLSSTSIPTVTYGTQSIEKKDNVFHIFPNPMFANVILANVLKAMSASTTKDIVAVYTNDIVLSNFYSAFKETLGANIKGYALESSMSNNPAALRSIAEKVMADKPRYVFMSNYSNLGSQFIAQLKKLPGPQPILAFDLTLNPVLGDYEKTLGDLKILDGSLVTIPEKVDFTDFDERYKKKYPNEPQGELTDYGYDSLFTLLETRAKSGSQWIANIEKAKIKGVTGTISFDQDGRRIPAISFGTFTGGKIPEAKQ